VAILPAYKEMLNMLTEVVTSAIIYVDSSGKIAEVCFSRRSPELVRKYYNKDFIKLVRLFFKDKSRSIEDAYNCCKQSENLIQIKRFEHQTMRNVVEYFDLHFSRVKETGGVAVCICDVTESVYLEQEFASISQQNEAANRELHAAMSKLDFRLMDLDQAHKKLAALYRITAIVQHTVNEKEVLEEIVEGITTELGFSSAAVLLLSRNRKELVIRAHRGYNTNVHVPYGRGLSWHAVQSRELVYVADVKNDPRYIPATVKGESEVAIPLIFADKVIGVLDIESSADRPVQPYDLDLLRSLAGQVALTIAHAQHVARVEVQAITDGLTGLYNYRYFADLLDREFKRATRYQRPVSLIMLDIDYFKCYNDTHGHTEGNEVLVNVANIIRSCCREVDFVVRYGGEEFAALLPETDLTEAAEVAERIRKAVADFPFKGEHTQPGGVLTISVGVAAYPKDAKSSQELLEHADTALYLAKRSTRNCVVRYFQPTA
jgi:diguanylate cyclase (GGDEF)-like protein